MKRHGRALFLVAAIAIAALLLVVLRPDRPATSPLDARAEALASSFDELLERDSTARVEGVAVLPLLARGTDPELTLFALALCEALVEGLAETSDLRVSSCESARAARELGVSDSGLARLLEISHVLGGQVATAAGGRIQVELSFASVTDSAQRWRLEMAVPPHGLQQVARSAVQRIAETLGRATPPGAMTDVDPLAYALRLRAVQLMRTPEIATAMTAEALLDQALAIEPGFTEARIDRLLNRTEILNTQAGAGERELADIISEWREVRAELRLEAQSLLERDPRNQYGLMLMMSEASREGRLTEAMAYADQLLALDGVQPGALQSVALLYQISGYLRRARDTALASARADPMSAIYHYKLAELSSMLGDDRRAVAEASVAIELGLESGSAVLALEALRRGDWTLAEQALVRSLRASGHPHEFVPVFMQGMRDPEFRAEAARYLDEQDEQVRFFATLFLFYHGALGATDRAVASLQQATQFGAGSWMLQLWHPELSAVRARPEFIVAMQALGAVDVWEERGPPDLCVRDQGSWRCR